MSKTMRCILNNREIEINDPPGMTALDFIRDSQNLAGTKEGCREGECGACTVLLGEWHSDGIRYKAVASCLLPVGELDGKHIVTVEGLSDRSLSPVQQALVDEGATQCGFCTPGIILSLTGFFLTSPTLAYADAIDALDGNICRCTGYVSIRNAVAELCGIYGGKINLEENRLSQLVDLSILPDYFRQIPERLEPLQLEKANGETEGAVPKPAPKGKTKLTVAGATDLLVQKPEEWFDGELDFISRYQQLKGIQRDGNTIRIGAGTSTEEMKQSPVLAECLPSLEEDLKLVSSTIMRNRATPAGNIANASPIGDLSIIFLALDASVILSSGKKTREVLLRKFFKGYKKMDLKKNEIITEITFPVPNPDVRFNFEKVSQRKYLDIASCNSAMALESNGSVIKEIRLSAGGVAPIPLFLEKTCDFLKGKEVKVETLVEAVSIMDGEIAPISDVRGTADYKRRLLRNLVFAHFLALFPEKKLEDDGLLDPIVN